MKMKIPNGGSGSGYYGHETGITSYMDNNSDTEPEVQGIGDGDFSEYLWMENEEEFDKQVLSFLFPCKYKIFQNFIFIIYRKISHIHIYVKSETYVREFFI